MNFDDETDYQARVRRGRPFDILSAQERLDWINNQANSKSEPEPKSESEPALTIAQRAYLGERHPNDLVAGDDLDNFIALGSSIHRPKKLPEPAEREKKFDPSKLAGSPMFRLQIWEAHQKLERIKSGEVTSDAHALEQLKLLVKPFMS